MMAAHLLVMTQGLDTCRYKDISEKSGVEALFLPMILNEKDYRCSNAQEKLEAIAPSVKHKQYLHSRYKSMREK